MAAPGLISGGGGSAAFSGGSRPCLQMSERGVRCSAAATTGGMDPRCAFHDGMRQKTACTSCGIRWTDHESGYCMAPSCTIAWMDSWGRARAAKRAARREAARGWAFMADGRLRQAPPEQRTQQTAGASDSVAEWRGCRQVDCSRKTAAESGLCCYCRREAQRRKAARREQEGSTDTPPAP